MKLVTWGMIFNSVVIPQVSLIINSQDSSKPNKEKESQDSVYSIYERYFRKVQTFRESS
jgi:hypothetical protein